MKARLSARSTFFVLALCFTSVALAQKSTKPAPAAKTPPKTAFNAATYDSAMLGEFAWRPIGPAITSGRVVDLAVAEGPESRVGDRLGKLMYAASASGGVWKSVNAGTTWEPVFDKQSTSSIGDIALAPSNPEIVWVAAVSPLWADGGEGGLFKTIDGGKTWTYVLKISPHTGVTDVVMDPTD